jgi:heme/copper-type cytochrome/quinol oxidase subunit 2
VVVGLTAPLASTTPLDLRPPSEFSALFDIELAKKLGLIVLGVIWLVHLALLWVMLMYSQVGDGTPYQPTRTDRLIRVLALAVAVAIAGLLVAEVYLVWAILSGSSLW